jgi:hypothetical protein
LYDEEAEGVGTPNMGFNVFWIVNFLCYKSKTYKKPIISFDFEKERITWVPPPVKEEVPARTPVLCGLNDRACCAYYFANTLTIYQCIFENDYTWEHLLQVNTPQIWMMVYFIFYLFIFTTINYWCLSDLIST